MYILDFSNMDIIICQQLIDDAREQGSYYIDSKMIWTYVRNIIEGLENSIGNQINNL